MSAEVNATTDLTFCLSLQQLSFLVAVQNELISASSSLFPPKPTATNRQSVNDSGVDCTSTNSELAKRPQVSRFVPFELLLTCNLVSIRLHKFERSDQLVTKRDVAMWRKYHHSDRKLQQQRRQSGESDETEDTAVDARVVSEIAAADDDVSGTEVGYEASEEGSVADAKRSSVRLIPLVSSTFTHPHIFASLTPSSQKVDMSVYDLLLCSTPASYHIPANSAKKIPSVKDFPIVLIETKPGRPDAKSGIRPALMTATISEILSSAAEVNVRLERPLMVNIKHLLVRKLRFDTDSTKGWLRKGPKKIFIWVTLILPLFSASSCGVTMYYYKVRNIRIVLLKS